MYRLKNQSECSAFAVTCDGSEKVVIRSEATQASPHAAPSLSALSIVKRQGILKWLSTNLIRCSNNATQSGIRRATSTGYQVSIHYGIRLVQTSEESKEGIRRLYMRSRIALDGVKSYKTRSQVA